MLQNYNFSFKYLQLMTIFFTFTSLAKNLKKVQNSQIHQTKFSKVLKKILKYDRYQVPVITYFVKISSHR